jgi:hypothetical protein
MMAKTTTAKNAPLKGKRIAILATDGFEESELIQPRRARSFALFSTAKSRSRRSVMRRSC